MAFVHGKNTVMKIATFDLSLYTKTSTLEQTADVHDTTGYSLSNKVKAGGLIDGNFTASGIYENSAAGPRAKLQPLIGTSVAVIRQPDGAGTTKAQDVFSGILKKYVETSPVDGMVTWSCEIEISGPNVITAQP